MSIIENDSECGFFDEIYLLGEDTVKDEPKKSANKSDNKSKQEQVNQFADLFISNPEDNDNIGFAPLNAKNVLAYLDKVPEFRVFLYRTANLVQSIDKILTALRLARNINNIHKDIGNVISRLEEKMPTKYSKFQEGESVGLSHTIFTDVELNKYFMAVKSLPILFNNFQYAVYSARDILINLSPFCKMPGFEGSYENMKNTLEALETIAFADTDYLKTMNYTANFTDDCLRYVHCVKLKTALYNIIAPFMSASVSSYEEAKLYMIGFRDLISYTTKNKYTNEEIQGDYDPNCFEEDLCEKDEETLNNDIKELNLCSRTPYEHYNFIFGEEFTTRCEKDRIFQHPNYNLQVKDDEANLNTSNVEYMLLILKNSRSIKKFDIYVKNNDKL